jgi:hypothetical protein
MARKSSKTQSKQPNAANFGNTATVPTTSQPADTLQVDAHAPATMCTSFFDFITLATIEDVKTFLQLASTTQEGKNLEILWRRAHREGYEKGKKSLLQSLERKMKEKYEEGVERGMNLGREEGFTVARDAFRDALKARKANAIDSGTQTDPKTPTTSISTQTNPLTTILHTATDVIVQTDPDSAQTSCQFIKTPSTSSTFIPATTPASTTTIGTQTEAATYQHLDIGYPTCVAARQSLARSRYGKNTKNLNKTTKAILSEISQNKTVFSSLEPSDTSSDLSTPSITISALETRFTAPGFSPKVEKVEISAISTKTTHQNPTLSISELSNDVAQAYASPPAHNDAILRSPMSAASASSSQLSQLSASTGHEKCALLGAVFESQQPTESLVHSTIVSALKTRSEMDNFSNNHEKGQKTSIFTPKPPEPLVSTHSSWADNMTPLPTSPVLPQHSPRDLSGLRSTNEQPFSSLRRRRGHLKNQWKTSQR